MATAFYISGPAGSSAASTIRGLTSSGTTYYGAAAGDGIADDGTAIQTVINTVAAAGGGDVYIPSGTYRVTQNGSNPWCLNIPSRVTLKGSGISTVIQKDATLASTPSKSVYLVHIQGNNVKVKDMMLDGNKTTTQWDQNFEHQAGFFIEGSNFVTLQDVEIKNCSGDGIQLYTSLGTGTTNINLSRVYSHDVNRQGMSFTSGDSTVPVESVKIDSCKFYNTSFSCIDSEPGGTGYTSHVLITNSTFDGGPINQGIPVIVGFQSRDWTITNSYLRGDLELALSKDVTIAGNVIDDAYQGGGALFIYERNDNISVVGNVFKSTHTQSLATCIRVESLSVLDQHTTNFSFIGNVVDCSTAPGDIIGMTVKTADGVNINGNTFIGPGIVNAAGWGIALRASTTASDFGVCSVTNNMIYNFGAIGLVVYGASSGSVTSSFQYLNVSNNTFSGNSGSMTKAMSLNNDSLGVLKGLSCLNNYMTGSVTKMFDTVLPGTSSLVPGTANNCGWIVK